MTRDEVIKNVKRKIEIRKYSRENLGEKLMNSNTENDNELQELYTNLEEVNKFWSVDNEWVIASNRKILGPIIVFFKKLVRKVLRWYTSPVLRQQRVFNSFTTKTLNYIKIIIEKKLIEPENDKSGIRSQIKEANKRIAEQELKLDEYVQKNISVNEEKILQFEKQILDKLHNFEDRFYSFMKGIYHPFIQENNSEANLKIHTKLLSVFNDENILNEAVNTFKERYLSTLVINREETEGTIVILCKNYKDEKTIEAIKKEAYWLYSNLREAYGSRIKFVSYEEQERISQQDEGIYFISKDRIIEHLDKLNPSVVHIFESNPHILFSENAGLLKYNLVFTITGQEPLPGMPEWAIDELVHFNDNSKLQIIVESNYTKKVLIKKGFKEPYLLFPFIDTSNIKKKTKVGKTFTVGFASSPMSIEQIETRGIKLLFDVIKVMPDTKFSIAWRNQEIVLSEEQSSLQNAEIIYGTLDMNEFYDGIDCLVIPYTSTENNHACSISAIEAMLRGIPVIVTEISGVSDVVMACGLGEICKPSVNDMSYIINKVKENYSNYSNNSKIDLLNKLLEKNTKLEDIYKIYKSFTKEQLPMLKQWDEKLKLLNKYLVIGHQNIKEYYSRQEIAEGYNNERFIHFPMNCYDAFEREAVKLIIEQCHETRNLKLLDIATGDGRILQELISFGECAALDSSKEMLKIVLSKFGDHDNLKLIKGDYFDCELKDGFDVITTFRYIRHFGYIERKKIYEKIKTNLNPNGLFIFDVPNLPVELKLREISGWNNFNIYDVFWTEDSIKAEMDMNGFVVKHIIPVGDNLIYSLPNEYLSMPLSWTIGVTKK